MVIDTGTLIAITIALVSSCTVMVLSILRVRELEQHNEFLRKRLRSERERVGN
jgi:hypothetical protein